MSTNTTSQPNKAIDEQALIDRIFMDESAGEEGFDLVDPPASLQAKLYAIPQASKQPAPLSRATISRWFGAAALVASVVIALLLSPQPAPVNQEALQAQKDFELALHYLNKANKKAASSVTSTINTELERSTVNPIVKTLTNLSSS
ncbi:hypothetical protein [Saccharophagus degradans]|uniref:Uncharacterized protein n=1 Tax=Saccharophagus degradans (strain 2-40 / ATCC 43961 / DSM 17024) TaxID=203122 RepID=Q21DS8_SACD2|nr:hypothetical protein [Saccharophagus degradans]ABD83151.1 hypothetical protein Sde_3896 [Saccharophagus degradans 2-40]